MEGRERKKEIEILKKRCDAPNNNDIYGWNAGRLTIWQYNAHSLNDKKVLDLIALIREAPDKAPDVILLNEVWNHDPKVARLLDECRYSYVTQLRPAKLTADNREVHWGGVGIAFRKDRFIFQQTADNKVEKFKIDAKKEASDFEVLIGKLISRNKELDGMEDLNVASIYWRPDSDEKREHINGFDDYLLRLTKTHDLHIVGGDWNAVHPRWNELHDTSSREAARGNLIDAFVEDSRFDIVAPLAATHIVPVKQQVQEAMDNRDNSQNVMDTATRRNRRRAAYRRHLGATSSVIDFLLVDSDRFKQNEQSWCDFSGISDHAIVGHTLYTDAVPILPIHDPLAEQGDPNRSLNVDWNKVEKDPALLAGFQEEFTRHYNEWFERNGDKIDQLTSEKIYRAFEKSLYAAMEHMPRVRRGGSTCALPKHLEKLRQVARDSWRRFIAAAPTDDLEELKKQVLENEKKFKGECAVFAKNIYNNDLRATQLNDTAAWKFFQRSVRPTTVSSPIVHPRDPDKLLCTNKEQAEEFLLLFQNKQLKDQKAPPPDENDKNNDSTPDNRTPSPEDNTEYLTRRRLNVPKTTTAEIKTAIKEHDVSKCPDFNGFDAKLLRALPDAGIEMLKVLFDTCLSTGKIPSQWRDAVLSPLFKAGKPVDQITSYRPVAITSLICRTYERVQLKRMMQRIKISPEQYGFKPGSGTVQALLDIGLFLQDSFRYTQPIFFESYPFDKGAKQFRAVELGLDFSDAFCRINADDVARMYLKIRKSHQDVPFDDLDIAFARMMYDFMQKRRIAVKVGSYRTRFIHVEVGSPQGGVLSPFLFSLVCEGFIEKIRKRLPEAAKEERAGFFTDPTKKARAKDSRSDVDMTCEELRKQFTMFLYYADDSSIMASGSNSQALVQTLRKVALVVAEEAKNAGLAISPKSTASYYARSHVPRKVRKKKGEEDDTPAEKLPPSKEELYLAAEKIDVTEGVSLSVSDEPHRMLGLWFDKEVSFSEWISRACAKASSALDKIRSIRSILSPATARALYLGKVQSVLLYAAEVWGPSLKPTHWLSLERVHRRGARLITGCIASTPTDTVLRLANLYPLELTARLRAQYFTQQLIRRPDDCNAKKRFLADRVFKKDYVAASDKTLRHWCDATLDDNYKNREPLPVHTGLPYNLYDTAAADNVKFDLDRCLGGKKEDFTKQQLLETNLKMYSEIEKDEERYELLMDGSVDPKTKSSGAAAALYYIDKMGIRQQIDKRLMNCGPLACIFTAEGHGLDLGLELAIEHCSAHPTVPIHIIGDSQSCSKQLERGPCSQTEWKPVQAWNKLLQLAQNRIITFHFAYSHCDWDLQDAIDKLAKDALKVTNDTPDLWWNDEVRSHVSPLLKEYEANTRRDNSIRGTFFYTNCPATAPFHQKLLRLPLKTASIIYRLQAGIERSVGGWEKRRRNDKCSRCKAPLCRDDDKSGVEHMFCCKDTADLRTDIFGTENVNTHVLYDLSSIKKVLKYWYKFTNCKKEDVLRDIEDIDLLNEDDQSTPDLISADSALSSSSTTLSPFDRCLDMSTTTSA